MGYDSILNGPLQVLDLFLFPFDRPLIGRCRSQKIDELNLFTLDLLPQILEPGAESFPFSTELLELVGCQVELKEKWPLGG